MLMRIVGDFKAAACLGAVLLNPTPAHALSLLGGGFSNHLPFTEFFSNLPYEDVKQCVIGLHQAAYPYRSPTQQPSKVTKKKTKTSVVEQLEFDKYGYEVLEFEPVGKAVRVKARYASGMIITDAKSGKSELAYEKCMGTLDDPLAASQFEAGLALSGQDRLLYETKFPPAQILACMAGYPRKVLSSYEASYYGAQITAHSKQRVRVGWARSRSMQLNHQKFPFSHFVLTHEGRTIVGFDGGSKDSFTAALTSSISEKSWMGALAKSCAVNGDDRDVLYWPRSDR